MTRFSASSSVSFIRSRIARLKPARRGPGCIMCMILLAWTWSNPLPPKPAHADEAAYKAVYFDQETPYIIVVSVVDGDTLRTELFRLPTSLTRSYIRLRGVDTPEIRRAKCDREKMSGEAAKAFVNETLRHASRITLKNLEWGRYGGRILSDIYVDGDNLSTLLIQKQLGRTASNNKRAGWCETPPPTPHNTR